MKITLIAAISADGFIARHKDDRSFDWTSLEDKKFYVEKIKEIETVVMGSQTFATFSKYPKGLDFYIYTRSPHNFRNPKPKVISASATDANPRDLVKKLEYLGKTRVAICGGASVYSLFMSAGLVNELVLTVEPIVFGQGVPLFDRKFESSLSLKKIDKLNTNTYVSTYQVNN